MEVITKRSILPFGLKMMAKPDSKGLLYLTKLSAQNTMV